MTKEDLLDLIVSWENLALIIREIDDHPENLTVLMEVALHSNHPKSWRAVWLADKYNDLHPEQIAPFLGEIIHQLKKETDNSKKRHLLKLISLHKPERKHLSFLLDYCLNCFTSASEPVAVRVHAMQILFNISEKEPKFKPELLSILEHEIELHPTAGIRARGRKLIQKLKNLRSNFI